MHHNIPYARKAYHDSSMMRQFSEARDTAPEMNNQTTGGMASLEVNPQQGYNLDKQRINISRNAETAVAGQISKLKNEQVAANMGLSTQEFRAQQDLQAWTAGIMEGQAPATAELGSRIAAGDMGTLQAIASMRQQVNGMNLT